MYTIEFYEDCNGKSDVRDYLSELIKAAKSSKTAKINRDKIFAYIKSLEQYGTRIGNPIVKNIRGDLWELRPLKNRIFFFYWKDNKFVLLHYFVKKTRKTPKREITKAIKNMEDWKERND